MKPSLGLAILVAITLTCGGRFSAATSTSAAAAREAGSPACDLRLSAPKDEFRQRLSDYDSAAWRRYIESASNSSSRLESLAPHVDLLAAMPEALRQSLLRELAQKRMRRYGNKRLVDLAFNLLDRGDLVMAEVSSLSADEIYRAYFAHEAQYFEPAYDADLVLSVAKAIKSALPQDAVVGFGGSFVNARADITTSGWDIDLLGRHLKVDENAKLQTAVEEVFRTRGLRPPRIDFHDLPRVYFEQLDFVYFDIFGNARTTRMWISPPSQPVSTPSGFVIWNSLGNPRDLEMP